MNSMLSQLLPWERKQVDEFARTSDFQMPLYSFLASKWGTDDKTAKMVARWSSHYPGWTPEQIEKVWSIYSLSQNVGYTIFRRVVRNDPAELAIGRCLLVRLAWFKLRLEEQSGSGIDDDASALIASALGVRDAPLAQRVADGPAMKRQDEVNELMRQSFFAAFRRDLASLRPPAERLLKRKAHRSIKSMAQCFLGMADGNSQLVASALQEMLDDANRSRKKQEAEIICLNAHDFYRLSEWVSPDLVVGFDVTQPLPWDAEFHAWTQDHENPLATIDLNGLSPFLHDTIINLKLPDWWRVLAEPELARDICELTLTSIGPNPKAVTEIVKTVARVRNFAAPDLGKGCPIVVGTLERVAACLLRRQLFEAGASAVIRKISSAEYVGE